MTLAKSHLLTSFSAPFLFYVNSSICPSKIYSSNEHLLHLIRSSTLLGAGDGYMDCPWVQAWEGATSVKELTILRWMMMTYEEFESEENGDINWAGPWTWSVKEDLSCWDDVSTGSKLWLPNQGSGTLMYLLVGEPGDWFYVFQIT